MIFYRYPQYRILVLLLLAFLLFGCGASHTLKKKNQYEYYSNLYGVRLKGNENLRLLEVAESWLGTPYKLGGTTKRGVDCSAFIGHVFKDGFGTTLPRRSADIALKVKKISKNKTQYGDLIFFAIKNKKVSHIGIYLGENKFLHASTSKGVAVAVINERYWKKYWVSSGRAMNLVGSQTKFKPPKESKVTPKPTPKVKKELPPPDYSSDEDENLQYIIPEI